MSQDDYGWTLHIKGGPGSGHFGHAGRPGQVGGSAPAGAYLALDKETRRATRDAVLRCLDHGLKTGNEACINVGANLWPSGDVLYGNNDTVDITPFVEHGGEILVHNHPTSNSFSGEDIAQFAQVPGLRHMVVIGHDGTLYRISKTNRTRDFEAGQVIAYWNTGIANYMPDFRPRVLSGELSAAVASRQHTHLAVQWLANELGLDYERVEP